MTPGVANGHFVDDAREEVSPFACPEEIWRGPYKRIAELAGVRDWRVWVGVTAALSARCGRNLHVKYHGNLYGMGYYLLVAKSAFGKALVTDLCAACMPSTWNVYTSVESGQALADCMLQQFEGDGAPVISQNTLLSISEWTMLLRNMDMRGSTLLERLCEAADARDQMDVNRVSGKNKVGKVRIPKPTLTMVATTTLKGFRKHVRETHYSSGLINRHLILPGDRTRWKYNRAPTEKIDYAKIAHVAQELFPTGQTFGEGRDLEEMYTPEAWRLDDAFGEEFFERLHNPDQGEEGDTEDAYTRLHAYNRRIAILYAHAERCRKIDVPHVQAAHAVVMTSYKFLKSLEGGYTPDLPVLLAAQATLEDLILSKVRNLGTVGRDEVCQALRKRGGYTSVSAAIERLVRAGALHLSVANKKKYLSILSQ